MIKATWKGTVIAESDNTEIVEGNHYFPIENVKKEFLVDSDLHTTCPWKGNASYYSIKIDDEINEDAVWYYSEPSETAQKIKGYVAFWRGVEVTEE